MGSRRKPAAPRGGPQRIGQVVSDLMAQKGFARVRGAAAFEKAWYTAVGPAAAAYTRPGIVRRGVLEVGVANSTMVQELVFQKAELLLSLRRLLPDSRIKDLRFFVMPSDEK
jgi:predicted nucleic acid-binding Zn ribbon protein